MALALQVTNKYLKPFKIEHLNNCYLERLMSQSWYIFGISKDILRLKSFTRKKAMVHRIQKLMMEKGFPNPMLNWSSMFLVLVFNLDKILKVCLMAHPNFLICKALQ